MRRGHFRAIWVAAGFGALIFANSASAHMGTGLPGGFGNGFRHPFSGVDHLLAMVSVGLWGAFLGRPLIYVLPVVFPLVMVGGAALGMFGVPLPPVEIGIALSVLMLGGCIALSLRAPVWLASLIVATFAVFHGYAHGRELPSAADPLGYSLGFVLATGLLHLFGIAIGFLKHWPGGVTATRTAGGIIGAIGVWFLYQALVRSFDAGPWHGAVPELTETRFATLKALSCVLIPCVFILGLPAALLVRWRAPTMVKLLTSWLIAVAMLAATLQLLPVTLGYQPDHLD